MARGKSNTEKIAWRGRIKAVQPRIRLLRSFDERHHGYQGYVLRIDGTYGDETAEFLIAAYKANDLLRRRQAIFDPAQKIPERFLRESQNSLSGTIMH